jgi:hypothetical protein
MEGVGLVLVPVVNEAKQSSFELFGGVEHTVAEEALLHNAEEDLDLVDPGGMKRRVDKAESVAVTTIESSPASGFAVVMNIEVIPDDVDFLSGVPPRHRGHELEDVVRLAARPHLSISRSGVRVKGRQQSSGPMANIFAVEPTCLSWRSVPQRVFSTQRLYARFLINAQNHSVSRRMQVELTDSPDLLFEFRVRAVKPHADAMGPDFRVVENSQNRGPTNGGLRMTSAKALQQRVDRPNFPTYLTKVGWIRAGHSEKFKPAQQTDFGWPAGTGLILQCLDAPVPDEPISPPTHRFHINVQSICHRGHTGVHLKSQQDSSSENFAMRTPILPGNPLQLLPLRGGKLHPAIRRRASSFLDHVQHLITPDVRESNIEGGTYGPSN